VSAQFSTLAEIVTMIQYRGNLDGFEQRHPGATLKILWNISWQELREMVSFLEDGTFLQQTTPATFASVSATTAASGEVYSVIDWPLTAVAIMGVRVKNTNGKWRALKPLPAAALHDYQFDGLLNTSSPSPIGYILKTIPFAAGSTETAGKIMILPVPSSGSFSIWYLEAWTPLTSDSDKVSGHAAWIEWSVWNTVIKARAKDGVQDATYRIAVDEREKCRQRIEQRASRLSDGLSMEPRDARGDGYDSDPYLWDD
jgi:hypothetical protein